MLDRVAGRRGDGDVCRSCRCKRWAFSDRALHLDRTGGCQLHRSASSQFESSAANWLSVVGRLRELSRRHGRDVDNGDRTPRNLGFGRSSRPLVVDFMVRRNFWRSLYSDLDIDAATLGCSNRCCLDCLWPNAWGSCVRSFWLARCCRTPGDRSSPAWRSATLERCSTLLHGSAGWRRKLGGVGRGPLLGCLDPCRAVQSQGSLSPSHSEAAA
jgi:hypothetical protein